MDKRNFVFFLILSMGVLVLSNVLFPPPPPPKPAAAPADGAKDGAALRAEGDAQPPAADDTSVASQDEGAVAELDIEPPPEAPLEYLTLGSLDRDTGFRMLVTFTNKGAAVHRAELTSPRFRDLHDRSGYLGHLMLEDAEDGVKIGLVGAGTPAANAGLKVGDIIFNIQRSGAKPTAIKSVDQFAAALSQTSPRQEVTLSIRRDDVEQALAVKLMRRPLEVMRPEIENIRMRDGTVPDGFIDPPSYLVSLGGIDAELAALGQGDLPRVAQLVRNAADILEEGTWEIADRTETSVAFRRQLPGLRLEILKRYTLQPVPAGSRSNENYPGYHLQLDVEVRNTGEAEQSVVYTLKGPTGLPIEGWWYTHKISQRWFSTAGLRDVVVRFQGGAPTQIDCSQIAEGKAPPMGGDQSLAYVGVDGVYFSSVMIPVKKSLDDDWFDITEAIRVGPPLDPRTPVTLNNISCQVTRDPIELAGGASQTDSYQLYIGPKRPELLAEYQAAGDPNYSLKGILYYGMWPFSSVARGMLSVLHFFYGLVGNYGIAIIMLTVAVRGALFPISFKQTQNMARMQALKPELDRITEKYKGDMQKRSQATQDLYRKHKINPLGGCLPVFLQLPIFIGLYRALMIDVELRQRPLFTEAVRWCSDLSAPDMFYDWSWFMPRFVNDGIGIFGLGPYFNLLPLITIALFLVSMKMSMPEPTNEQAVLQQKMMKYMTGFMGLLFYKVASGLCIYFIASSMWGIGERKLLNKAKGDPTAPATAATTPARTSSPGTNGHHGSRGRRGKAKRKR